MIPPEAPTVPPPQGGAASRPAKPGPRRPLGGAATSSPPLPPLPPKAPKPRKARHAAECEALEQLPNIGPSIAADLRSLGVMHPKDLAGRDAFALYQALGAKTGRRQDPCVLDTFLAACDFMRGAEPRPWWHYTAQRKAEHGRL